MAQGKAFFTVRTLQEALQTLLDAITPIDRTEALPTAAAAGRVLAIAPTSPIDLPQFNRSTMDGFAVRAADTFGASDTLPAYLAQVGSVPMGAVPGFCLETGQTAEIFTGAMLPDGADAVVMIERTQQAGDEIEVLAPVAPGENVVKIGEDVAQGAAILPAGHRLRPQDIGGLLAVGVTQVTVMARPRVAILSSGDELVTPDQTPELGQIRDINSDTLAALFAEAGAVTSLLGIAADDYDDLLRRARDGLSAADMLVLTAGSSLSTRDLTVRVVDALGAPGVLQHGLAVKPGKPTILGVCAGKPVFGLPGNPVSAFVVARQVVLPALRHLHGEPATPPRTIPARLTGNVPSRSGRLDTVPVRLSTADDGVTLAEPVFGKSNLIYTLIHAQGLVEVPLNTGGFKAGETVAVMLF